jgi:hypothetical protein
MLGLQVTINGNMSWRRIASVAGKYLYYVIYVIPYRRCIRIPSKSYITTYYVRLDNYLPEVVDEG